MIELYKTYGIYGIQNKINNRMYVGKTMNNFGDRRDCHFTSLRGGYGVNRRLQHAWDKYGEDNFEFIILYNCLNNENSDDVNHLEKKFIQLYRERNLSYNFTDGGDGGQWFGSHMSDETKRKIGEKNKINMTGRKFSITTRKKMSESQKRRYRKWSDEERMRFGAVSSEKASGYTWSSESKENFSKLQHTKPNGAKYTIDDVRKIRTLHENNGMTFSEISQELNIPRHTVYQIATYRRWKYA